MSRTALPALAAFILAVGVASSAATAKSSPGVGTAGSATPQLFLISGGSLLYEDPTFETLASGRVVLTLGPTHPGAGSHGHRSARSGLSRASKSSPTSRSRTSGWRRGSSGLTL